MRILLEHRFAFSRGPRPLEVSGGTVAIDYLVVRSI